MTPPLGFLFVLSVLAASRSVATTEIFSLVTLVVVGTTCALVVACVLIQYEVFAYLGLALAHLHTRRRRKILFLVLSLMFLHVVEIWLFGLAFYVLLANPAYGALHGGQSSALLECVYFSAVLFTTLGLGDLVPEGAIRFLVGTEALSGFILISWSAAFTYLEMQRFWRND